MAALIKALAKSIGPKLAIGLALGGGAWAAMHVLERPAERAAAASDPQVETAAAPVPAPPSTPSLPLLILNLHDYFPRQKTMAGGCCDCGDLEAWKKEGFCAYALSPGLPPPIPLPPIPHCCAVDSPAANTAVLP